MSPTDLITQKVSFFTVFMSKTVNFALSPGDWIGVLTLSDSPVHSWCPIVVSVVSKCHFPEKPLGLDRVFSQNVSFWHKTTVFHVFSQNVSFSRAPGFG